MEAGINVNTKTANGFNCLLTLADQPHIHYDFIKITQLLIDFKIDLNAQEKEGGKNILIYLCENFDKHTYKRVELLLRNGMDVNSISNNEFNALLSLAKNRTRFCSNDKRNYDFIEIIKLFLQKGIDVNQKNSDGMNALHLLW